MSPPGSGGVEAIAAIAPVVGGMAPAMAKKFHPAHPVSILIIQGDADPLVPIRGGTVGFFRGSRRGHVIPTEETISLYVRATATRGNRQSRPWIGIRRMARRSR